MLCTKYLAYVRKDSAVDRHLSILREGHRDVHELELAYGDGDRVARPTFSNTHAHKEAPWEEE